MTLAERLLAVVEDAGFSRLKRVGTSAWELWLRDGVLEMFEGSTLESVLAQAEARIARRGQP